MNRLNQTIKALGYFCVVFYAITIGYAYAAGQTPSKPQNLSAVVNGSSVSLSWSASTDDDGVVGYNVYRNDSYLTTVIEPQFNADIDPNVLTQFSVVAFDNEPRSFSERSDSVSVPDSLVPTDLTIPPSTPEGLQASLSGNQLRLTWNDSTDDEGIGGYNVYRDNQYLDTVQDSTWSGTVNPTTVHQWSVVAFDIRNNFSPISDALRFPSNGPVDTTVGPSTPTAISGQWSNGTLRLRWQASSDDFRVAGYNVYRDGAYLNTVFTNAYTQAEPSDASREYSVVAFDDDGNFSPQSLSATVPEASAPIDRSEPPSTPSNLSATTQAQGSQVQVNLSWQQSTDNTRVAGYNVYLNDGYHATVFDNMFEFRINRDEVVALSVVAFDPDGNFSQRSASVRASSDAAQANNQAPSAVTNLTGTYENAGSQARVEIRWNASTDDLGVAGYNVYQDGSYVATVFDTVYATEVPAGNLVAFQIVAFDVERLFSPISERLELPESGNRAPTIPGIEDQFIVAGPDWEYVIAPTDPDGPIPGLFISGLPVGMRSVDNFDGTRSLTWRPLQPDVGVHPISIKVIDAENPTITTDYQININVRLPDDLSIIPNFPPTIDAVGDYVMRSGDAFTMRVKAVDVNGTVPNLTVVTPLEGATFEPHPEDPLIRLLRWTLPPGVTGTRVFEFRAEDADDPSLVATGSATFDVRPASAFTLPGERLRTLAATRGIKLGFASLLEISQQPDAALYESIANAEFDMVTAENSMKWGYINPEPGRYRFADADRLARVARENQQDLHAHALVWYTQLPNWVINSEVDEREGIMNRFIDTMVSRYNDDVAVWDVVNEAFEDDGTFRNSVWFEAMGESHIDRAFRRTRNAGATGELIYNDYDVAMPGPKSEALIALMTRLVNDGVPIDGVGFQMHLDADFSDFAGVANTFARIRALGLDIYITELDVSIRAGQTEAQQASVYSAVLRNCLNEPNCKALQVWGFTDRYSWRRQYNPLLLDREYQPKPAYQALQEVFLR